MMIEDAVLMTVILPVIYVMLDVLKPTGIPSKYLPLTAVGLGFVLGLVWAVASGVHDAALLMQYAAIGLSFGAGAVGVNQFHKQLGKDE